MSLQVSHLSHIQESAFAILCIDLVDPVCKHLENAIGIWIETKILAVPGSKGGRYQFRAVILMGKWQSKAAPKKKEDTSFTGVGFSPSKTTKSGLKGIVSRYAEVAHLFTERGGRGILSEASMDSHLYAVLLVPGDTGALLHKLEIGRAHV